MLALLNTLQMHTPARTLPYLLGLCKMLEGLARIIRVSGKDRPPYLCPTIRRGSGTWKALDAGTPPHMKTGGFAAAMRAGWQEEKGLVMWSMCVGLGCCE